jgi:hypothetical protein
MNRKAYWILLVILTTQLGAAAPSGSGSCDSSGWCYGGVQFGPGSYFSFSGPSNDVFSQPISNTYPGTGELADFGVGSNGGSFDFPGSGCDYFSQLNGVDCEAAVSIGSIAFPTDYDSPTGSLVTIKGPVSVGGNYCNPCNGNFNQNGFSVDGIGTFHYKVVAPTAYQLTSVEMTFGPAAPEPATCGFLAIGLGIAIAGRWRRKPANEPKCRSAN